MKVAHIGIAVKNLEDAIEKYIKIQPNLEYHIEKSIDGEMRIALLKFDNIEIELLEPLKENSVIDKFIKKKGEGIHHIALEVKNINEKMQKLKNSNIKLVSHKPKLGSQNSQIAFLHPKDLHGVLVELCQRSQ